MSNPAKFKFEEVLKTETPQPVNFVLDWTIPNFSLFRTHKGPVPSIERVLGKSTWYLDIYPLDPNGAYDSPPTKNVGLYLVHSQQGNAPFSIGINAKLGVVDAAGNFLDGMHIPSLNYTFTRTETYCGSPVMVKHWQLWGARATGLVDGALKLRAEVSYMSLDAISPFPSLQPSLDLLGDLQKDFHRLYEGSVKHDCVLVTSDGFEMSAHRAVLMARSPVFLSMLQSQMTENRTGRCVFPDMPKSVLIPVVKFIYSGFLDGGIEDDPVSVLLAADRLQVTGLVKHCEEILIGHLTSENVVDLLLLADKVPALALKDAGLRFVRNNLAALKGSGAIRMLMEKAGAELADEIMALISNI